MSQTKRRTFVQMPRDRRISDIGAAAREVFCERGFEAASTAEIAARAGVSEGTLYKYFENKRDLLIKVLESWYQSMLSDYASQLESIPGARNKIYYIVSRHLRSLKENADLARLSYHEVRHSGDYYESKIYEFNREYTQVFVETCREGIRNAELRADVPVGLLRDLILGGGGHVISGVLRQGGIGHDRVGQVEGLSQFAKGLRHGFCIVYRRVQGRELVVLVDGDEKGLIVHVVGLIVLLAFRLCN